ncbi:MAG: 50S ribosomal protein L29 [Candidatus Diapherotrites archaeon]|nr:50S ribosomal protein L29 [Candidatus Diapherotrites archaeon]
MKAKEVRQLGLAAVQEKLFHFKEELSKERAVLASGTRPENPGKIRALRRDIARAITIINEKKKAGETIEKPKEKKEAKKTEPEKKEAVAKKEKPKKMAKVKKKIKGKKK